MIVNPPDYYMKKISCILGIKTSVILLLIASFVTVITTLLTYESAIFMKWLYGQGCPGTGYIFKAILLLLWVYPSMNLLYITYRRKSWQETLFILVGLLVLFLITSIVIIGIISH